MPLDWRGRYCNDYKGVCDFKTNYDFYFKWLANKLTSCFILRGAPETVNVEYLKLHLMLDGYIAFTKVNDELYAVSGAPGGEPDEYYLPTIFTLANPILGSKTLRLRDFKGQKQNAVMITNTAIDRYNSGLWSCGLFDLVHQTAVLLADNIVSLSCCQINSRVQAILTAESETQATAAEAALKKLYAGAPFTVVRSDLIEKINVSPLANSQTSATIAELLQLHNYIIAQFFKSIGVQANSISKKERLITDEIEEQHSFVALSLTEILASWLDGFNEVNKFFNTNFEVELNPVIVRPLLAALESDVPGNGPPEIASAAPEAIEMQEQPQEPRPEGEQPQEPAMGENADGEPATPEPEAGEALPEILDAQETAVEAIGEYLTGEAHEDIAESEGGEENAAGLERGEDSAEDQSV